MYEVDELGERIIATGGERLPTSDKVVSCGDRRRFPRFSKTVERVREDSACKRDALLSLRFDDLFFEGRAERGRLENGDARAFSFSVLELVRDKVLVGEGCCAVGFPHIR